MPVKYVEISIKGEKIEKIFGNFKKMSALF